MVKKKRETPWMKGNQFAKGHGHGRPAKYDFIQIAQDLEEWSKKTDSLTMLKFTYDKPYLDATLREHAASNEDFAQVYNKAMERIAWNRMEAFNQGTLHLTLWNRYASIYDLRLKKQKMEMMEFEAKVKAKAETENGSRTALLDFVRFHKLTPGAATRLEQYYQTSQSQADSKPASSQ